MKSYNETVDTVFRRMAEYETAQKRKRRIITDAGVCLCCACIIAAIGIGTHCVTAKSPAENEQANVNVSNSESANRNKTDGSAINSFFIPADSDGQQNTSESETSQRRIPTVYSYPGSEAGKYRAPKNGEIIMSTPLRSAIEKYGDSAYYAVEIFLTENEADVTDRAKWLQEYERMQILNGGKLGFSTSKNSDGQTYYILLGHVSKDCLENFPVSDKYGYFIQLSGDADEFTENFNVLNGTVSNTAQ
ncbi:MAG: hypothetical protein K2G60_01870 [Oscillospiraceae bacterium]|nr:hypothetical protein [Oscillospiraceae bacterium]